MTQRRWQPLPFAFLFALVSWHGSLANAGVCSLDSAQLHLGMDSATGSIVELIDPATGRNVVDPATTGPLWTIEFSAQDLPALTPAGAKQFHVETASADSPFRMRWSDFELPAAPNLRVTVEVEFDTALAQSYWSIAIDGLEKTRTPKVCFPRIGGLAQQTSESLAVPVWLGEHTTKPRELLNAGGEPHRLEWTYPGILSMQCAAFYGNEPTGFYAACDDTAAFGKRFAFFGDGKTGAGFEVVQLPENSEDTQESYHSPYRVALGVFGGDWFSAAERYRKWALRQPWAVNSRLKLGVTSQWAVDTGLWVWNRGRSENVLPPAAALQEAAGVPVSVFWHWWHGCAYDIGFPEYLPPREGESAFEDALRVAHEKNLHAIVYMNQRLWGMTTESWKTRDAARFAVKKPNGEIQPEVYNTFTQKPCASMCMGTSFWRDTYAGLATEAVTKLGVDGIYMDQACSSLSCYDPTHGHPIGGGTYWIKGFQLLQGDIRARCTAGGHTVTLAGEGCGEAWLPYLDLMLSLQVSMERYAPPKEWEPIPFFHAVYHGYCLPYGNYSSLTMPPYDDLWPKEFAPATPLALLDEKYSQQFRMEQARAFVWGQVPTIANFRPDHLESRAKEMDFVIKLAKLRQRAKDFLLSGTMLSPPEMEIREKEIPISRLSIYAGQQGALTEYTAKHPELFLSAWQSPDGNVAVVIANVSDLSQPTHFKVDAATWSIALPTEVKILEDSGAERSAAITPSTSFIDEALPASAARVYIFPRGAHP